MTDVSEEDYVPGLIVDCMTGEIREEHNPDARHVQISAHQRQKVVWDNLETLQSMKETAQITLTKFKEGQTVAGDELYNLLQYLMTKAG